MCIIIAKCILNDIFFRGAHFWYYQRGCLFLAMSPIKLKKSSNQLIKKREGYEGDQCLRINLKLGR